MKSTAQSSSRSFILSLVIGVTFSSVLFFLALSWGALRGNAAINWAQTYFVPASISPAPVPTVAPAIYVAKNMEQLSQLAAFNRLSPIVSETDKKSPVPIISSSNQNLVPTSISRHLAGPTNPIKFIRTKNSTGGEFVRTETEKEKCAKSFSNRKYLPEGLKRLPPMFYTFPGSGNTWGRLLIEYATGIYSGSVYNDISLLSVLPGEFTCNWQVSVVKAHPHTHRVSELTGLKVPSDDGKCNKGNVRRFHRAILLIRDPYDSIWSEYQRRLSKSHVDGIVRSGFSWQRWQANAASLAHYYYDMWAVEHAGIERMFQIDDYIYVKYEDLKDEHHRLVTLQRIVDFLRFKHLSAKEMQDRLQCAFLLAENKNAHRKVKDQIRFMTKEIAYVPDIACRMWALFGSHASKHGYQPWAGYNCTGYRKIPPIYVGPGGEIDRTGPVHLLSAEKVANLTLMYTRVNDTESMISHREMAMKQRATTRLHRKKAMLLYGGAGRAPDAPVMFQASDVAMLNDNQISPESGRGQMNGGIGVRRKPGTGKKGPRSKAARKNMVAEKLRAQADELIK
jgi:hypothetical protein